MRSWALAAGLMAAAVTTGAQAADLDDGPPPDRYGSAYDDPRYADIYKYPKGPGYAPYVGPLPRERVYRDDDEVDYDARPRRYSYTEPAPYAGRCLPRELVKERLLSRGWHDFHQGDIRGEVATVHARRPSGRLFLLSFDRCSGEVLSARPLEGRPFGPYAYGPRRWERFY
jgi:hypothetical protein